MESQISKPIRPPNTGSESFPSRPSRRPTTHDPNSQGQSEEAPTVCGHCAAGPLALPSFRRLMDGEEIVYETTQDRLKSGAQNSDSECGLCFLLHFYAPGVLSRSRPPDTGGISFRFAVMLERAPWAWQRVTAAVTEEGEGIRSQHRDHDADCVQYLSITEDGIEWRAGKYYIYTSPDDPSADEVVARSPILEVSSPRAYELARMALDDCITNHEKCPKPDLLTPLPTRVIDCKDPLHPRIFVSQDTPSPYAALSYVWGGPQTYCTKTSNVDTYIKGIDTHLIPKTIHDAIEVANKLGLRYLWVDALCILQDSDDDKARELLKMCQIYRDAYVTIIASSATGASTGFLQTRVLRKEYSISPQLPFHCRDGRVGRVSLFSEEVPWWMLHNTELDEPIDRRAWCLQEFLLSPRKLVYATDTVGYHCQTTRTNTNLGHALSIIRHKDERLHDVMFMSLNDTDISAYLSRWNMDDWQQLHSMWWSIIENYTCRSLSYEEDKLVALSAVAQEFDRIWGSCAGRYIAGLWENFLLKDLLWFRAYSGVHAVGLRPRLSRSFAPSWSWASTDGPCSFEPYCQEDDAELHRPMAAEVLQCDARLKDEKVPFGHVVMPVSLTLRAVVVPTPWMFSSTGYAAETILIHLFMRASESHGDPRSVLPKNADVIISAMGGGSEMVAVADWDDHEETQNQLGHPPYIGSIDVSFDEVDSVTTNQTLAVVVRRHSAGPLLESSGLLVTDAGDGTAFRRAAYWKSDRRRDADTKDADSSRVSWIDVFGIEQNIVLV